MTRRGPTSSQTDTSPLSASLSVGTTSLPLPPVIEFACAAHTLVDEYVASSPFDVGLSGGTTMFQGMGRWLHLRRNQDSDTVQALDSRRTSSRNMCR